MIVGRVWVDITDSLDAVCPWHGDPRKPLSVDVGEARAVCNGCGRIAALVGVVRPLGDSARRYALLELTDAWHGRRSSLDSPNKPLG